MAPFLAIEYITAPNIEGYQERDPNLGELLGSFRDLGVRVLRLQGL